MAAPSTTKPRITQSATGHCIFVNGLPLGLIELKNAADEGATIWSAYAQLQTYKAEIPSLAHCDAVMVVSDGECANGGGRVLERADARTEAGDI